jgi:hypothetical protein
MPDLNLIGSEVVRRFVDLISGTEIWHKAWITRFLSGSNLAVTPELELLSCALEYAVSFLIAAWVLGWR